MDCNRVSCRLHIRNSSSRGKVFHGSSESTYSQTTGSRQNRIPNSYPNSIQRNVLVYLSDVFIYTDEGIG